jgi:hypothetical protein
MNTRLLALISMLMVGSGCGPQRLQQARAPAHTTPDGPADTPDAEPASAPPASPKEQLSQADLLYSQQLGAASRDDRYVDRQVAALREAIVLYQAFIEHAKDDPQYADAVRKSRERIEDAQATIDFLLAKNPENSRD